MGRLRLPSPYFSLIVWGLMWEIVGRSGAVDLIPPLTDIAGAMVELTRLGSFWEALVVTGKGFALGLGLAVIVGVPIGVLMGLRKTADRLLSIWVDIFISAPLTALDPALMPLLGIGQATIVATVFLFSVWVIIIDSQAGIQQVNRSLVEMGLVFGADRRQLLYRVILPAALPEIATGLRMGVIRGIKGVIIGQVIIALIGFGGLFELYLQGFLMERFWALVFVIFGLAFVLIGLVERLEKRIEFYAATR